jgi:two-component system chemotaxis response regulator CheB
VRAEDNKPAGKETVGSAGDIRVVAMGSSTGGPPVLHLILSMLKKDFRIPILIVQHISKGFISNLAYWLQKGTELEVRVACDGESIMPGHVYFAPDDVQMGVDRNNRIILSNDKPFFGNCPSVSYLFRSVNRVFQENAIGVLLTGMGKDGAEELRLMRENGAVTIAQDKESSVVHGMPGQAVRLNAAMHILSPERIAFMLNNLSSNEFAREWGPKSVAEKSDIQGNREQGNSGT